MLYNFNLQNKKMRILFKLNYNSQMKVYDTVCEAHQLDSS